MTKITDFNIKWHKELQQGTDKWHKIRKGRFGASGIKDILTIPRAKKDADKLSSGGQTKAKQKAFESVLGDALESVNTSSKATDWGNDYEGLARRHFEQEYFLEVSEVGYVEYGDHAGVSPDGVIFSDSDGVEIKCPYNQFNHLENCLMLKDNDSFKKLRPEYYAQVQYQMMVCGFNKVYFVSFDPRLVDTDKDHLALHVLEVTPDQEYQELIQERLEKAIAYKLDIINQF